MNNENELLPKWLPQTERQKPKGDTLIKIVLFLGLYVFTLGFITMFDYTTNGMKGRH